MPRRIRVIETGKVYGSIQEAAAAIGGSSAGVSNVLHGRSRQHMGFTFAKAGTLKPAPWQNQNA